MTDERPGSPDPLEPTGPSTPADPGADTAPYAPPPAPPEPTPPPPASPPTSGWSPPVVPRQEVAPGLVLSDTPSRFVAYLIDLFLIGIATTIIAEPFGWNVVVEADSTQPIDLGATLVNTEYSILAVVIGGLYFVASWSGGRRATLGQRLFNIQVGNAFDGRPLSLEQAIRRWLGLGDFLNLFGFTPALALLSTGLLFIWTIVLLITTATSPTKQGLHDRLANSAVVRPTTAGTGLAYGCLALVVVLFVVALLAIVSLIFLGAQVSSILSEVGESI
jgi:uncharacterized RDD family membrane protein YckC